jgi:hypothetical protein
LLPRSEAKFLFCLTFRVQMWDERVAVWLGDRVEALRELGLVEFFQRHTRTSWRNNIDRYEPTDAGDTPRSLGVTQSENLRELVLRAFRDNQDAWADRGVSMSAPQQSLLVRAAGLSLHPMKSRDNHQQEPSWSTWRWTESSNVRLAAARDNRVRYTPDLPGHQWTLPGMGAELHRDPTVLRHAAIVYCGDLTTGRTAGWMAVPSADQDGTECHEPWMAAVNLWWDEGTPESRGTRPGAPDAADDQPFDARPMPAPAVSLKPARRKPAQ